jgi:hypothetical protein
LVNGLDFEKGRVLLKGEGGREGERERMYCNEYRTAVVFRTKEKLAGGCNDLLNVARGGMDRGNVS